MFKTRKELKAMKKDILEQIKAGIEVNNDLYIKGFRYIGDGIFEGNLEKCFFDGNLTKSEINISNDDNYKVYKRGELYFYIVEDEFTNEYTVDVSVQVQLVDEYDNIEDTHRTLNI